MGRKNRALKSRNRQIIFLRKYSHQKLLIKMNKEQAKKRIGQLKAEIEDHRYRYNALDKPVISDAVYDSLFHQLTKLEEQYPDLITMVLIYN